MSEQDNEERSSGFRRVSRKDRKRKLESRGPLIPPEPEEPTPEELFAPPEVRPAEVLPPVVESPPAERFPPVALNEPENRDMAERVPATPDIKPRGTFLPNLIAILFFVASILLIVVFSIIFVNPYTPLNPFPPFTPIPILITATFLPPTPAPPATETPLPTLGPTATFTPIPAEAMPTTQASLFPFMAANGGAVYVPNGNDKGCDWASIAGSVTDLVSAPLDGYGVHITGENLDETVFTGSAQTFGPGGFELFLNGAPQVGTYAIQLLSPAGVPLSEVYTITTRATCEENVTVVSFLQTRAI